MRQHLFGVPAAARAFARPDAWWSRWLEFSALVLLTVVLVSCLHRSYDQPPMLDPLLAVPPALAGIGAPSVRRPLAYGAVSLVAAVIVALKPTAFAGWLPVTTIFLVVVITVVATAGTAISVRQQRRIADVTSVAEAAQRALLRPPPARLGPLGLDVVYLAAAAEAKVGGDLYEVTRTAEHGIRVIMGDVQGKGLGAVELAADVLGMFRELAHDACTLADLAARLDAGLGRSLGRHEEFVTALLIEIDPESGQTSIYNCGHPAPLLIPAARDHAGAVHVTPMEVPAPAPPLGLLSLGDCSRAQLFVTLQPDDQLLLYTDGITEARDAKREFYSLPERVSALTAAATAAAGTPALVPADGTTPRGLLDLVRADVLKHVGAPLDDDAALLLVRAPAAWPATRLTAPPARVTALPAPLRDLGNRARYRYGNEIARHIVLGPLVLYVGGMRMQLRGGARDQLPAAVPPNGAIPWQARWLELTVVVAAAAIAATCLTHAWPRPLELAPLLAVPPALAAIGAKTVLRPLAYGAVAVAVAVVIDVILAGGITATAGPHQLALAAAGAAVVTTALGVAGQKIGDRAGTVDPDAQELQFANMTSVAEAAQRAVLRPLPEQLGPLKLGVVYLAAAAEARVGGDLYEVTHTEGHGIRLIIGDVRGKGLGAVEVAADIIGRFREVAHGVGTLNEVAHRLDAGLSRRWGQYEEFVTALLAEIDPDRGKLTILNCGHPPPILISSGDGSVTVLEVRAPAPPLGLITLGSDAGAKEVYTFKPNDQLLLYTDGVTEARDASREFYPLDERVRALASQAQPRLGRTGKLRAGSAAPTLLDLVRDDLLRYVGAPPDDDAALLLVRAPAAWPGARPVSGAQITRT